MFSLQARCWAIIQSRWILAGNPFSWQTTTDRSRINRQHFNIRGYPYSQISLKIRVKGNLEPWISPCNFYLNRNYGFWAISCGIFLKQLFSDFCKAENTTPFYLFWMEVAVLALKMIYRVFFLSCFVMIWKFLYMAFNYIN